MYESHFGLRQRPFTNVPDSASYFPAAGHDEALLALARGLGLGEGVVLLTGSPGLGKTLLTHCLVDRLPAGIVPVVLTGARMRGASALLQAILFDLALPFEGLSEQELRLSLVDAFLKTFKTGGRTAILVDEAHHLTPDLLEELRLLGNLEAKGGKAVQVVLIGLPPILRALRRPELAALRQRLVVRTALTPLTSEESLEYLGHQVKLAGGKVDELFAEDSLDLLAQATRGVPRLLNQAGHQAMLLAFAAGSRSVDVEAAHGALEILGLSEESEPDESADGDFLDESQNNDGELLPLNGGDETEDMPGISPRRFVAPARLA